LNQVIEKLLGVQEVDETILAIKSKLAEGPRRIRAAEAELERHRTVWTEASRRAKEAMRVADRKNSEVEAVDERIRDLSLKQNTARSNKEYEAFKLEIAGLKADREILEEEALQQWEVGEDREAEAAREEAKVASLTEELAEQRAEWEEEAGAHQARLAELEESRRERSRGLPPTWIDTYERLLVSQGTPVLVPIVEQYCQGCQMNLSIHDVTRAWKGAEIVRCRSCSRILYAETL
jgi:predicted  nucleic acid-binding Zn-ribbon protein